MGNDDHAPTLCVKGVLDERVLWSFRDLNGNMGWVANGLRCQLLFCPPFCVKLLKKVRLFSSFWT